MIPNILAVAGSDPSGGAGIQADIKAISAQGAYAMAALTALTAQNTRGVAAVHLLPESFVGAQIDAVLDDIRVDAVKIGMVGSAAIARVVARTLDRLPAGTPVVLDPVMVAKGGAALLDAGAVAALRETLLPRATVVTPNLPEAAALLGRPPATDRAGMEAQARSLRALGPAAVLLKGGHLGGEESPDLLVWPGGEAWLDAPRVATASTHGTGCTLSSALAARLGRGDALPEAAARAKRYVAGAIEGAHRLSVGHGHGPTHHFHALWTQPEDAA